MTAIELKHLTMNCLQAAWNTHATELRHWTSRRLADSAEVEDLLQDLFLKAMRQGERFCSVDNARAWLFEVARNALTDRLRARRDSEALHDDLPETVEETATVDQLVSCLPRVLSELNEEDREAITWCDLQGMPQAEFARLKDLSVSGAKSRLQRARERLRTRMTTACQVKQDDSGQVVDFIPRSPAPY